MVFKAKKRLALLEKVIITFTGFVAAVVLTMILEDLFPGISTGAVKLRVNDWLTLLCFTLSTVLLPAITEEAVFRKNMIALNMKSMVLTSIFSAILFSAEQYLTPWGILLGIIWAIPLTYSYIRTQDVYIPLTAHFFGSIFGNGIDIFGLLLRLSTR